MATSLQDVLDAAGKALKAAQSYVNGVHPFTSNDTINAWRAALAAPQATFALLLKHLDLAVSDEATRAKWLDTSMLLLKQLKSFLWSGEIKKQLAGFAAAIYNASLHGTMTSNEINPPVEEKETSWWPYLAAGAVVTGVVAAVYRGHNPDVGESVSMPAVSLDRAVDWTSAYDKVRAPAPDKSEDAAKALLESRGYVIVTPSEAKQLAQHT